MTQALGEIKVDEMMASLEVSTGRKKNRRAVVFYMDSGKSGNSLSLALGPNEYPRVLDYSIFKSLLIEIPVHEFNDKGR